MLPLNAFAAASSACARMMMTMVMMMRLAEALVVRVSHDWHRPSNQ